MEDLRINETIVIPAADLEWTAVRASGPGGQNVNKVATKVDLRFDLVGTTAIHGGVKARLRAVGRIDADGRLVVTSQLGRSQQGNLEDARAKLGAMIRDALVPPKPRRATRPTLGSKKRRLNDKKKQSEKKNRRQKVGRDD